jgi:hypothetical protein
MSDNPPATPEGPTEPVAPAPEPPGTTPPPEPPSLPPKRSWWKVILIVVVALIGLGVLATALGDNEAEPSPSQPGESATSSAPATESAAPPESAAPSLATPGFADITLSGTGDAVPSFEIPEDQAAIAVITHTGSSNFAIWALAEDGTENDLLVNVIGNYSGTVLFDERTGVHSVAFEITADGAWTVVIRPITAARAWDGAATLTGSGDDVVLISPALSGLTTAAITHDGASNFAIVAYDLAGSSDLWSTRSVPTRVRSPWVTARSFWRSTPTAVGV